MANDLEALRVHLGLSEISILGVLPIGFAPNSAVNGGTSPKQEEISNVERPIPLEAPVTLDDPAKREELLQAMAHGSAAAWGHLNLLGEYDFSEDKLRDSVGIKPPKLTD